MKNRKKNIQIYPTGRSGFLLQNLWQNGDENEWKNKAELHAEIEVKMLISED